MKSSLSYYNKKKVLVTGHTGFKGSWLCAWLKQLNADVLGIALPPPSDRPNLYNDAKIAQGMTSLFIDIRDFSSLKQVLDDFKPEIIFHLAAQALVRTSYRDPITTYATNVLGTVHVLEAARTCPSVHSILVVTTDKCYQNKEWVWGYREVDTLGGKDPYSTSKACAELIVKSYQETVNALDSSPIKLASARGGNVIGGGDWAEDRLVPDIVSAIQDKKTIILRNPTATRPWQHVLELLRGYLTLVMYLGTKDEKIYSSAWNFGPTSNNEMSVESLVRKFISMWGEQNTSIDVTPTALQESHFLRLDASKAQSLLGWHPSLSLDESIQFTVEWYKGFFLNPEQAPQLLNNQIAQYSWS